MPSCIELRRPIERVDEARPSNLSRFGQRESVVNIHTKIPDGILDLAMPEQNLDRPQVAGGLVNDRRLRSAQRMRSIFFRR